MMAFLGRCSPAHPSSLRQAGVLGMNRRNVDLLVRWNPRRLYQLVNDKAATKELCTQHGISVPQTYVIIDHPVLIRRLPQLLAGRDEFVIKPVRGAGGRGVLVITGRGGDGFLAAGGGKLDWGEINFHMSMTLAGAFSIGGRADRAIIEQRIACHGALRRLAGDGTPDVRLIVYRGVVVMAMLRLPTAASQGKANLHQGAAGLGLDLEKGLSTAGYWRGKIVDCHPDSGETLAGIAVPHWPAILDVARRLARAIGLGYLGVDVVPTEAGPIVLEANGRPGLSIQLANRHGLLKRIAEVESAVFSSTTA